MPPSTGRSDGGGGAGRARAALFDVLGLGGFVRLDLPTAAPHGLELAAAADPASCRITVSLGGARVSASPGDLAAALELPLGPVGLSPEVEALLSSAEAIAALIGLIWDRVLLGAGEDGGAVAEVAVALRLVAEGKAHVVDWGWLVWAVVWRAVVTGEPRRCVPHLLRLMECQRPELFAEVDGIGRLLAGKRSKGLMSQPCPMMEEQLVDLTEDCSEIEVVEKESLPQVNISDDTYNFTANQPSLHFHDCVQQILDFIPNMGAALLDKEKALMETKAAACRMREELMEKDRIIHSTKKDIQEENEARYPTMRRLEQDWNAMLCTVQQYKELCHKSSAAHLEYRTSRRNDMADGQNRMRQQQLIYQVINGLQKQWFAKCAGPIEQITNLTAELTDLNSTVKRMKVPDLNN